MNTEEKIQGYSKGTNRYTTSLMACNDSSNFLVKSAFAKPQIFNDLSVSSVPLLSDLSSPTAQVIWKERTAGSLSNDKKIGDEKNE